MRVLYESLLFDVERPGRARGPGHVIYRVLERAGMDLQVLGPPAPPVWRAERWTRRLYQRLTGRRYLRFPLSRVLRMARALETAALSFAPDVVLTMFPAALWHCRFSAPAVYRVDATYHALLREYPAYGYGPWTAAMASSLQARACRHSALIVTHSEWCRDSLARDLGVPSAKIRLFANASGLPPDALPAYVRIASDDALRTPVEMLLVGDDFERKGLDIAVETVRLLRSRGVEARLTVCGAPRPGYGDAADADGVHFAGRFDLADADQLGTYADLYRRSHLLLHPTRFDSWAMVTSEAAAFAVPTLTNAVAGMTASVLDGETGLVLPKASSAAAYAEAVHGLLGDPPLYRRLRRGARHRYEREMSWESFGDNLISALEDAKDFGRTS